MANPGRYCKAYTMKQLRAYPQWGDLAADMKDDDVVFLQEDHSVTKSIFVDEEVLRSDMSPEWIAFCRDQLAFLPDVATST
jgi:hypothetical protein